MFPDLPVAVRTPTIIGRTDLLTSIKTAIASDQRRLLFFIGPGGIGKTRLLEEVGLLSRALRPGTVRLSGIIDLYHASHHSSDGLRMAVADGLDPEHVFFASYRAKWREYSHLMREGVGSARLQLLYRQQAEQFHEDYARLASESRLVLSFDTVELIQYESDLVQQLCQVQDDDTAIKNWFLLEATSLPNTVILLAGRPQARIQTEFRRGFETAKWSYVEHELGTFSEEEANAYLDAVFEVLDEEQQSLLAEMRAPQRRRWLFASTGGQPIRLMIYLELCRWGNMAPALRDGGVVYTEHELDYEIFQALQHTQLAHPNFRVDYLYRARKGLDIDLLRYLDGGGITEEELEPTLKALTKYGFIKYRLEPTSASNKGETAPPRLKLFLHDELYDRYDRYFTNKALDRAEYHSYVEYYRERVASARGSEREELMLTQLYYELQHSPRDGFYRSFAPWNTDAIQDHALSFDIRLRDEVLRFFNRYAQPGSPFYDQTVADLVSQAAVDRDSAVRWVMRYFSRGRYPLAIAVADTLHQSKAPSLDWAIVADPLYKASLLTEWAVALLLNGALEAECLPKLNMAVDLLRNEVKVEGAQELLRDRVIGRALTHIGYVHRTIGHYGQALNYYLRALPFFKKAIFPAERAGTLNNLAYVQALLERVNAAKEHVNEALEIRQRLGNSYPIALSQNTLGRILTMQDRPDKGQHLCEQALDTFRQLNEQRGVGLALIGAGYALRKRADQWKVKECTAEEADAFFVAGERQLLESIGLFSEREPLSEWEANNELGSLYCDWGWLVRKGLSGDEQQRRRRAYALYKKSEESQRKALKIAMTKGYTYQIVDSLDDLAQLHEDMSVLLREMGDQKGSTQARQDADGELAQVLEIVPERHKLVPGQFSDSDADESATQWRAIGKVHLLYSRRIFEDLQVGVFASGQRTVELERATREMLIAAVYFKKYQQNSFAYDRTPVRLARLLRELDVPYGQAEPWIAAVEADYGEDLALVREILRDVLGI